MNQFFIQTKLLLSGQCAPFTGEAINMARSRDAAFTAYTNLDGGSICLQYESPFFKDDWVSFYSFDSMKSGYASPVYLSTPVTRVRAIASGVGNFWCGFTAQN